ncbi:MAG TPA: PDZ domain-containing protein [Candidatus Sulfotelmatobacter sp.]|jgi:hypothetical protein
MRKYVLTSIVLLPSLLTFSQAAQNWSADSPEKNWSVFSSEDSGTSSYLGVDIADVTTERLSALKLKEEKGVEVTMVDQDAPAGKAGIKEHDVILTMNGATIESGAQLRRMIHEMPPGRVVSFGLSRDGQAMSVKVQLADKHGEFARGWPNPDVHVKIPEIHIPDIEVPSIMVNVVTTSARSGLSVENITPQLGEFFGVKNGNGVLVRSVEKGSRAERAGIRAGDVIVKVNDEPVHDTSDFMHAVRSRNGKPVTVGVIREKREQILNLTLPESRESGELLEELESLPGPQIDADANRELRDAQNQVADLGPMMELVQEQAKKSAVEARKELCDAQKKLRERAEEFRKQQPQRQQFMKEFEKSQKQLKMELDQLLHQSHAHSFDI